MMLRLALLSSLTARLGPLTFPLLTFHLAKWTGVGKKDISGKRRRVHGTRRQDLAILFALAGLIAVAWVAVGFSRVYYGLFRQVQSVLAVHKSAQA
jgi:hypothetical protein